LDARTVTIEYHNPQPERLDKFLSACFPEITRSQIQRLIGEQHVFVNQAEPRKTGQLLENGDVVQITFPPVQPVSLIPEKIPLDILFENEHLLAVNKPAGMVVHPSAGHYEGTLVHALLGYTPFLEGIGGKMRPGIVHRLDKDTSGIILIAKNDASYRWLQRLFKQREIVKKYLALVDGHPGTPTGRIIAPIYRDKIHRKRMAIAPMGSGKPSETVYRTIKVYQRHSLLEAQPLTGRTHQIRVHLSSIGSPICGDKVYGYRKTTLNIDRHFLHANELTFRLPGEKKATTLRADLPDELIEILNQLQK
jgi:23S rRNA pseudouridine1911/1915/1917 synthase